jgi:hypothetical protein
MLPVPPGLAEALTASLRSRGDAACDALFVNRRGGRLQAGSLQRMLKRWLRDAGLDGRGYTIHSLRHTFATLALRAGVDVRSLQDLLGHEDLSTTALYLHTDVQSKMTAASKLEATVVTGIRRHEAHGEGGDGASLTLRGPSTSAEVLDGLDDRETRVLGNLLGILAAAMKSSPAQQSPGTPRPG